MKNRGTTSRALALGVLVAALVAAMLLATPAHASTTFTVNSTADDGDLTPGNGECYTGVDVAVGVKGCTLRAAIQEANAFPGADVIEFDIPATGVATITPATQLPTITRPVTIDGYSQPGAEPNTLATGATNAVLKIELNGQSAGSEAHGLQIQGSNSVVRGLVINRFGYDGIYIEGPGNKLTGNFIGTDPSGTLDLGNRNGVKIQAGGYSNTVGGSSPGVRNLISGNDGDGVQIDNGDGSNQVLGNLIGTKKGGAGPLGNSGSGVVIDTPNNTVGDTMAGARNVISANGEDGVDIQGADATGNKVMGNYIGTGASGTKDLGNKSEGVYIYEAPNNTIGGTTAAERNVISGNGSEGVQIFGNGATGNKVTGNYVGTDASGTKNLGNDDAGVGIRDTSNNTIGGTQAGACNVISGNGAGVYITGDAATGNRVLSNSIYANIGLGIDLAGTDGPTPNDEDDPDTGPNYLQNKPVLTSATTSATRTTVRGTLNSTPNKTFLIQFFSNPSGEEGKTFRGHKNVTTDASGDATFTFTTTGKVGVGQTMTATATGAGNTSEFSAPRRVVAQ
ncbi:MAG: CSLREA domain-containing protein [Rubrobacter sp.]